MATAYNPSVVTNGLVLCLDAGNPKSYPGSGTAWTDLSGRGNNASLVNSPIYTTTDGGYFTMDGVDDYATVNLSVTPTTTFQVVYKLLNPSSGFGPLWRVQDWRERIFPGGITLIASSGTYYSLSGPISSTDTICITYSYDNTSAKSYRNGLLVSSITMDSSMATNTFSYRFGNQSSGSTNAYINMQLYQVLTYNRALSAAEVAQNYAATRGRFGI